MVIDFHTHSFAHTVVDAAIGKLESFSGLKTVTDSTVDGLRAFMAQCGVDISVVQPVATKPAQVSVINDWAKKHRCTDMHFFGALHPDDHDFAATAGQLKDDGFKGVKLHPDYQSFFADEDRIMPLYQTLADLDLTLVLHAGVDNVHPSPVHCTPLMIRNIIDTVPTLRLVLPHMGSHALWRDAEQLIVGRDIYIDTSYSYYALKKDGMRRIIDKHGADRVLFGTDFPWKRADEEIENIRALGLSKADTEAILFRNAQRLLGLSD